MAYEVGGRVLALLISSLFSAPVVSGGLLAARRIAATRLFSSSEGVSGDAGGRHLDLRVLEASLGVSSPVLLDSITGVRCLSDGGLLSLDLNGYCSWEIGEGGVKTRHRKGEGKIR